MEVKPGYKQTEVGVIPEEWEVVPLHDLSERIMVGIASAATHAYRDIGIPMLRNQNIKPCYLDDADILHISAEYEARFRTKRLKSGDLITARTGYPGTTSIVPPQYNGAQSFTTLITRPCRDRVDPLFLSYYINSRGGQTYFEQTQIGGGQKNVNAGSLKHLPVPLPPTKTEQCVIAKALSDADALIESLEQLIDKKRHLKQGAMQELLTGKRRLPGFKVDTARKNTDAGPIPQDWEVRPLSSIARIERGRFTARPRNDPKYYGGSIPFIQTGDIKSSAREITQFTQTLNQRGLKVSKEFRKGTIFFTIAANIGDVGTAAFDTACPDSLAGISSNDHTDSIWLIYELRSRKSSFEGMASHNAQMNLNLEKLRPYPLPFPPLPEQTAIASVLTDMDAEIEALESRLAKARQIKQGMMQELLTGRIRLV